MLAARLVGCLLLELVAGLVHMVVFLFRRGAERERIRSMIVGHRRAAALILAAWALLVPLGGCQACRGERMTAHPGTSLEWHWYALVDSLDDIFRMRDWKDSLSSDLEDLVSDDPCKVPETFDIWGW